MILLYYNKKSVLIKSIPFISLKMNQINQDHVINKFIHLYLY